MKGARRNRKPRQQAGFADLMTSSPSSNSLRGVVTGVSRAQRSSPTTPTPATPNPTSPPPPEDDWGALLHTTPKRRFSPQKPNRGTSTPHSTSSRSSSTLSPRKASSVNSPRRAPSIPSPKPASPPPQQMLNSFASPTVPHTPPSSIPSISQKTSAVPAFLSGWEGADGWGDDPPLDDSDQETHTDPWGVWEESDDILSRTQPDTAPPSNDNADANLTPVSAKPAEQSITQPPDEPLSGSHDAIAHSSLPEPDKSCETVDALHHPDCEEFRVSSMHEEVQPTVEQSESIETPIQTNALDSAPSNTKEENVEAVSPPEPQLPKDEAQPAAGFGDFSGWAVEEPPQQPLDELPEPVTQQTDTAPGTLPEDSDIPVAAQEEEQSEPVPVAGSDIGKDEAKATGGFGDFSGLAVEIPTKHPSNEFPEPETQKADASYGTAVENTNIPATGEEQKETEAVTTAVPNEEADGATGFGDFSGWAVQEPSQQPSHEFPELYARNTDASHGAAAEDSHIRVTDQEADQPRATPTVDPDTSKDEYNATGGFDNFSSWSVEEPPLQPHNEFPEPNVQHADASNVAEAEDSNIPTSVQSESVPLWDPSVSNNEADGAVVPDSLTSGVVEEPPQQPLAEMPALNARQSGPVSMSSGRETKHAHLPIVSNDDQRLAESDPQRSGDAQATAETNVDKHQEGTHVEPDAYPDANISNNADPAVNAPIQSIPTQTPFAVDSWAFETNGAVPADDGGWGWREPDVIPAAQPDPTEKPGISEETSVTVSSNITAQTVSTSPTVVASVVEEPKNETSEKHIETAFVEQEEADPKAYNPRNAVSAEQSAGDVTEWDTNEGDSEVNLDDWGWGAQADGEAGEFNIGVNSSQVPNTAPPPTTFSHTSSAQMPANDWLHRTEDSYFRVKEDTTLPNDNEETTTEEPGSFAANSYNAANPDFSMYAPSKANIEREVVAETPQVDVASHHEDSAIADRPGFNPPGLEVDSSHVGVAENAHSREGSGEGIAATRQTEDPWTTSAGFSDVNVSSTNAVPGFGTTSVLSPEDERKIIQDVTKPETQTQSVVEVPQQEDNKNSSGGLDNTSFLWSGYNETPQPDADRSWANPDAIWSSPPVSIPVDTGEKHTKKNAYDTHESTVETQLLSEEAPATEMPTVHTPQSRTAITSNSIGAPDMSNVESNVSFPRPPIQHELFQRCDDPREAHATFDSMSNAGEKHVRKAPSERIEQDQHSAAAVEWQGKFQSDAQARMSGASGAAYSTEPHNSTLSNSYWTERLDESKSLLPGSGKEGVQQAPNEHKKVKEYESTSWSPSHDTDERDPTTKSADFSYSGLHTNSHQHDGSGTHVAESVTAPWLASTDSQHHDISQNRQWPVPKPADETNPGPDHFEVTQGPLDADHSVSIDSKGDQDGIPLSEHSFNNAETTNDNFSSQWSQYAPRNNSLGDQKPPSIPSPNAEPSIPVQKFALENHETAAADASMYDPFSVHQDRATVDKTKVSHDAFEWGYEPQKDSSNPQVMHPAFPITEGQSREEAGFGSQHDSSGGARSSTHTAELRSNVTPNIPTSAVPRLPVDGFHQVFQTQTSRVFQTDSQASHDWNNAPEQGGQAQETEADIGNGPADNVTDLHFESSGASSRVDQYNNGEAETKRQDEAAMADSTPRRFYDAQDPQFSSNEIDVDCYAPRTKTMGHSMQNTTPAVVEQSAFEAFDAHDNKREIPQATPPMERTAPHQTPPQTHAFAYQSTVPDATSSYSLGASYAPSVPPVPATMTSDGSGHRQLINEATELAPSPVAPGIAPIPKQTSPEISSTMIQPSAHASFTEVLGETPEVPVTGAVSGIQSSDQNRHYSSYPTPPLNGLPHASSQSLDQQRPHEPVPEAPEVISDPWSSYGPRDVPQDNSVTTETTASQLNTIRAGYDSIDTSLQGQMRGGYDTISGDERNAYGSYTMSNEPSYGQDITPPPPEVPFVQPTFSEGQDAFQAESIVDPSAFSYPYSIMDTEITGDFSTRPQRPLFSWGFGGKLVTVIPRVTTRSDEVISQDGTQADTTSSSTVHIHDLKDIAQDGSNDDWAAASEAVSPVSFPARTPDLSIYAEMCDRLSKLSVGLKGAEAEGRAALWRVLALLCREGTSDWRAHASAAVSGPSSVPMFGRNDSSSLLSGNSKVSTMLKDDELDASGTKNNEAATEVERLLTLGRGMDAVQVAQEAGLWSIALVLSATMDRSLYLKVVSGYAKSVLHDGSALQTLCLSVAEDESEILRKATSPSGLREWRKTVGMLLTTVRATPSVSDARQSRFLRLIDHIGEALISQNSDVVAGHVCFLISGRLGPLDVSNIQLLGADPKLPAGRPGGLGSPAAVLQSLVLEATENATNGATYPHLLPHRLVLAEEICAVGKPEVALAHCEAISLAVRNIFESGRQDTASEYFTLPFLSRLESLEQRLRVHLGKADKVEKKGGLTALRKSLSSVFKKRLTNDSRSVQPKPDGDRRQPTQFTSGGNVAPLPRQPGPIASPPLHPNVSSERLPNLPGELNWAPKLDMPAMGSHPSNQSSSNIQSEPVNDGSGNERWNSIVSKTIGFLAPAEGDLSPPLKARNDQGVPFHAQPSPLGLGGGAAGGVPTLDPSMGHMRSASVGDVPMLQRQAPTMQIHDQSSYSHQVLQGTHSQTGINHTPMTNHMDQTTLNGVPVQKTTVAESNMSPTHRRAASDMTFESQTSEKKPPRPPKKSPTLPSCSGMQPKREKVQPVRGWRSRLSEKIRAAFSGPPRAHMGVDNKFKYDKEQGRWIIEGEDPDESNDEPPPPPEDDPAPREQATVPYSQSYESLPNPDLGNHFSSDSQSGHYQSDNEFNREGSRMESVRRYSHSGQIALNHTPVDNGYSRDTGSESSVASAASAPAPYSSEPTVPMMANPGNKFRARPGRASGRRAYVDTFNKGTPPVAVSAAFPNPARPRPPVMNGLGSQAGGGYRIFTPSPAPISHGSNEESSFVPGNEGKPVTSSTVHSNENLYQTHAQPPSENDPTGSSVGDNFQSRAPVQSA